MEHILEDRLKRRFPYLRLSVTEHCNFRCGYCLPHGYQGSLRVDDFLRTDEILRLLRAFSQLGVEKVRLTGGEPTLRRDLEEIIKMIRQETNISKIALSTNGHDLERKIIDYRKAGLTQLNVSLDDVDSEEFRKIRGRDMGASVLRGIDHAFEAGFSWVKVNTVLMKDSFAARFERFEEWVKPRPVSVRFIELMRTVGRDEFHKANHQSASGLHRLLIEGGWAPQERAHDAGPAVEYAHPNSMGRIGIIAPYAPGFCDTCNRLRVSSVGKLHLCLFGTDHLSLREFLQRDEDQGALIAAITHSLYFKADGHELHRGISGENAGFSSIGG